MKLVMTSYQAQKLRITSPRCLIFSKDKPYNAAVKRDSLALCHLKFKYTVYDYTKVLVKNRKKLDFWSFCAIFEDLDHCVQPVSATKPDWNRISFNYCGRSWKVVWSEVSKTFCKQNFVQKYYLIALKARKNYNG